MPQATDPVSKLFNVIDARLMVFGATLIDSDDATGHSEAMRPATKACEWTPKNSLLIYPKIKLTAEEEVQTEADEKTSKFGMAAVWNNGFIPLYKGMMEANNMKQRVSRTLNTSGFLTTDQVFRTRQESRLNSLFSAMKWYSSNDKKVSRLIDTSLSTKEDTNTVINLGMICENWVKNPVSVKYVFRQEGVEEKDITDYIYLIGGSRDLLQDNVDNVCDTIANLYKSAKHAMDSEKDKKITDNNLKVSNIQSKTGIWQAYNSAVDTSSFTASQLKILNAMRERRKMVRLIQGVIYIRNYLVYAQTINLESVLEFEAEDKKICKSVKTKDVQHKYERAFQYCKNLINIYPDIANCAW